MHMQAVAYPMHMQAALLPAWCASENAYDGTEGPTLGPKLRQTGLHVCILTHTQGAITTHSDRELVGLPMEKNAHTQYHHNHHAQRQCWRCRMRSWFELLSCNWMWTVKGFTNHGHDPDRELVLLHQQ